MGVARITVPESLDVPGLRALAGAITTAVDDPTVSLMVFSGTEGVFCQGLNLQALDTSADPEPALVLFGECLRAIQLAPKPTLALIAGPAQGGGVGLAAACDVVIAEESATFALPELLLGLTPATILPVLLGRMPVQQIRLWALDGVTRDAKSARFSGLVDQVIHTGDAEATLRRWSRTLSRVRPSALGEFKRLLAETAGLETAICRGAATTAAALRDPAVRDPLRAFARDGVPPWERGDAL